MGRLYKISEVAKLCNVTSPTVHNWVKKGLLKMVTFPYGRKKISKDNLMAFFKERGMDSINLPD